MGGLIEERAKVVYERHPTCDDRTGPGEYGRVGFEIGGEVFWVAAFYFPGTTMVEYAKAEDFANTLVTRWNAALEPRP